MKILGAYLLICILGNTYALSYSHIKCVNNASGFELRVTPHEFFTVYSKTFAMSDGSIIQDGFKGIGVDDMLLEKSFIYIHTLMSNIGIDTQRYTAGDPDVAFKVCDNDLIQIFLFAVIGNFITNPLDPDFSVQSSASNLASIVIDVYTGQLVIVNSYSAIRPLFLEALLVLCIIIIARLTFVRNIKEVKEKK
jgi:hypothetical protein